jgi:hypothetical protein
LIIVSLTYLTYGYFPLRKNVDQDRHCPHFCCGALFRPSRSGAQSANAMSSQTMMISRLSLLLITWFGFDLVSALNASRFVLITMQHSGSHFVRGFTGNHSKISFLDEIMMPPRRPPYCMNIFHKEIRVDRNLLVPVICFVGWGVDMFPSHRRYRLLVDEYLACNNITREQHELKFHTEKSHGFILHAGQGPQGWAEHSKELVKAFSDVGARVIMLHRLNYIAQSFATSNLKKAIENVSLEVSNVDIHKCVKTSKDATSIRQVFIKTAVQYGVPLLYVPYETINTNYAEIPKIFKFIGYPDVRFNGTSLIDDHIGWRKVVSSETKHHIYDPLTSIANKEEIIDFIWSEPWNSSTRTYTDMYGRPIFCKCMLFETCDFGPVAEVKSIDFQVPSCSFTPVSRYNLKLGDSVNEVVSGSSKMPVVFVLVIIVMIFIRWVLENHRQQR